MLTKDQAQAVSKALLQPARSEQVAHAAEVAQQTRALTKRKWVGGGALFGLAIGIAIGRELPVHPFVVSIIGFTVGAIAGALVGKLRA